VKVLAFFDIGWWLALCSAGAIGATARYLNEVLHHGAPFSIKRWGLSTIVGCAVAILTGFAATHFGAPDMLTHALSGVAAISAKEIIAIAPKLCTAVMARLARLPGDRK